MRSHSVLIDYLAWHYSQALKDAWHIWMTFIWFVVHFFALPVHISRFFYRFKKLGESYPKGLYVYKMIGVFIVNSVMRLMGMVIRLVLIFVGLATLAFVVFVGGALLIVWILFPIVVVSFCIIGILLFFDI